MAGPKRPQDRVLLTDVKKNYRRQRRPLTANRKTGNGEPRFANEGGDTAVGNGQAVGDGQSVENGQSFDMQRRRRGDRRHHLVHQHLQPGGDAGRRPGRAKAAARGPDTPSRG